MLRLIILIGMSIPSWTAGVQCNEDSHCAEGYYCELDYSCRKCLRCEDFKRAPPLIATECLKSMVECGACLEQKSHSSNNDCGINAISSIPYHISGGSKSVKESNEIRLPVYAWVLLVLIIAIVIGGGVTLIPWINKVTYATVPRSDSQIPGARDLTDNAWSSPPAYNTVVDIPRPNNDEDPASFIKSEPLKPVDKNPELSDRQATQPFSPPNYVRHPQPSPTFTHDQVAISNIEDQSSVDGVIAVRIPPMPSVDDALPTEIVRNMDLEGCPNIATSGSNQSMESSLPNMSTESARRGPPVVVVNNNVHLQSVSLSGASIFLPQSSHHIERR